jgi:hypothetical protein
MYKSKFTAKDRRDKSEFEMSCLGCNLRSHFLIDIPVSSQIVIEAGTMASVKAASRLARELDTIAGSWVRDPFRPNLQFPIFLQSLATHPRLTPQAVQAARALRNNKIYKQVCFSREPTRFTDDLDASYFL